MQFPCDLFANHTFANTMNLIIDNSKWKKEVPYIQGLAYIHTNTHKHIPSRGTHTNIMINNMIQQQNDTNRNIIWFTHTNTQLSPQTIKALYASSSEGNVHNTSLTEVTNLHKNTNMQR